MFCLFVAADLSRKAFLASASKQSLSLSTGHKGKLSVSTGRIVIDRSRMYEQAIEEYVAKPNLTNHFNMSVRFSGELAVDFGGVTRDFFSGFWEETYVKMFDGSALLAPVCHAEVDLHHFEVIGTILSHGYLCCGFLPTRIAFPVLASVLLGLSTSISQEVMVRSFSEFLSLVDRKVIALALEAKEFTADTKSKVTSILSTLGCREMPTPHNLKRLLCGLARHQFRSQPFAALCSMNAGVPKNHQPFWLTVGVEELFTICDALTANPEKVLERIVEPDFRNSNEQRVFGYLQQYVGGMKLDEAKRFMRFVTGSSVVTCDCIRVCFNSLSGLARRPLAHTCSNQLELPHNYNTFLEFVQEWTVLLGNEDYCWSMDSL